MNYQWRVADLRLINSLPLRDQLYDKKDTLMILPAALPALKVLCQEVMDVGMKIDLSDCHYGETTGSCTFLNRPTNYYFFLAGLVKLKRLTHILEIGTNSGGSIMSIAKGLRKDNVANSRLVTVDIVLKNDDGFKRYPNIRRIQGDSLVEDVVRKVVESFDRNIDLLYIDSLHEYEHTRKNLDIYASKLKPRYVVLDDIRQCDDMRRLWNELEKEFGENAFDASNIAIRKGAGFGIIRRNEV